MAKRAAPNEQPYRPLLDTSLLSAVIGQGRGEAPDEMPEISTTRPVPLKVIEITRASESVRKVETKRAEEDPAEHFDPTPQRYQPVVEKIDQEKRVLFTRPESQAIDRLVNSIASRLNCQVKASHVMRSLVTLMLNAEGEIDKRAGEVGALVRPPNGDAQALQRFEREIAKIIGSAIRDAGPLR